MSYNFLGMFAGNTRNFTGWAADVAAQKLQVALWRNGRAILKGRLMSAIIARKG